jgi:hypothetical protein
MAKPFYSQLKKNLSNSLEGNDQLDIFDYTFISEMLRMNGDLFLYLLSSLGLILLIYMLLKIFLSGATIGTFLSSEGIYNSSTYWTMGFSHFWRILRVSIYFLLIYIIVTIVFYKIYSLGGLDIFEMESDQVFIHRFLILIPFYAIMLFIINVYHQFTKVHIIVCHKKYFFSAFWDASKLITKDLLQMSGLVISYLFIFAFLYSLYYLFLKIIPYSGQGSIVLALCLSQIFIIARLGYSMLIKSGICNFYKKKVNKV